MIVKKFTLTGVSAALLLLSGCAVGPDYQRPEAPTCLQYKEAQGWSQSQPQDQQQKGEWWAVYQDPQLSSLLQQVAINNQNVAQYAAQYAQAKAMAKAAGADLYPQLDLGTSVTRSGSSAAVANSMKVSGSASWELDLWGKLRRTREEQTASAQASAADLANALLSAQSELAQNYFQLRILDARIEMYDTNIKIYSKYLTVVENQYKAGMSSKADVAQARNQLHSVEASEYDLTWQRAQYEHAIAVLVGKVPSTFKIDPAPLSYHLPQVPGSIPSALLQRRPDIAAAERSVASANAAIGVAIAGYYPDLTLSATGGYQSSTWSDLFSLPSRVWSIGPELSGSVLDFGRNSAEVDNARAAYDASVASYRQTVLSAFAEVEDYLAETAALQKQMVAQKLATDAAMESAKVTMNQYQAGMISYLNAATTEATSLNSQQNLLSLVGTQLLTSVKLIAALGGGWDVQQLPATE
ncbi:efflux transporter outer membrane subunit [Shewanella yunxiaonensis]|uniref:Efflux transporter outer membrane subunit n=1 Tax=Shewanella yunxiaonensis TaxID=2829809 RepID=A0ABX7YTI8_9GAMM|nr:efflux transporter outer membrane subunit [Shewanella yunxiaonensis]QUN05426.1 efflux transporter outer membrane subunit [Shewanella yunxiaonensis]